MNTINITPWLLAASLLAGCAAPPAPPSGINPAIMGEFDKAAARKPEPRPREVDAALLPPLRMEMPAVAGKPIEPRFDLSVSNAPAQQVFMSLVSGTRYSMLVHPAVTGAISVSLKDVTLEGLPTQLYWGRAELVADVYPVLTLKLTVYTVSFDQAWLIV